MAKRCVMNWRDLDHGMGSLEAFSAGRRIIGVEDGVIASWALMAGKTIEECLEDYAAGYDADQSGVAIDIRWEVWDDCQKINNGERIFKSV